MITFSHPAILTLCSILAIGSQPSCGRAKETPATTDIKIPTDAKTAIFAGGCFWCMEPPFEKLAGVYAVISGYTGGKETDPTYQDVSAGKTSHREAVEISYDPNKVTYQQLLDIFWQNIDPTQANGQFADIGPHYKTAIFYADATEKNAAEKSKKALQNSTKFPQPIVVEILAKTTFYPAEEYHQDYYKKNSAHYKSYRKGSGREAFLQSTWQK